MNFFVKLILAVIVGAMVALFTGIFPLGIGAMFLIMLLPKRY